MMLAVEEILQFGSSPPPAINSFSDFSATLVLRIRFVADWFYVDTDLWKTLHKKV